MIACFLRAMERSSETRRRMALAATASLLAAGCGPSTPARPSPVANRQAEAQDDGDAELPRGLTADCFAARSPCRGEGDLDGDGVADTVVLVRRADGKRGFAILWGARSRPPTVLGAGAKVTVVEVDDDASLASATRRQLEDDLGFVVAWDVLASARDGAGRRVFVGRLGPRGPKPVTFALPAIRGDGLRISGGDSAWVIYLSVDDQVHLAPLGY